MSIAADKLEIIREQVQFHLDHAERKQLTPEQESALKEQIKQRLVQENAVLVAHYYTAPPSRRWRRKPAAACQTRWKWRALATITRPRRWWCAV